MDTRFNKSKPQTRAAYRAKFSGLMVRSFGQPHTIKGEWDIELRPLSRRSDLYGIFVVKTNGRVGGSGHSLRDGKACAESMFVEKLEDWHEVETCFAR